MSAVRRVGHRPQLDSLRAFAVSAVLIHHFFPVVHWLIGGLAGFFGVKLFFVLSGFLITRILLEGRTEAEAVGMLRVARQFYIRRTLRIFPLYYFAIAAGLLLGLSPIREELWWLVTYSFNFRIALTGVFPESISHFWTLAVEEQFYLVWPWFILLLPSRRLVPVTVAIIAIGPLYRILALTAGFGGGAFYATPFSSLDALGGGALLAMLSTGSEARASVRKYRPYVLAAGLALFAIVQLIAGLSSVGHALYLVFIDSAVVLVSVWLVSYANDGFTGTAGYLFDSRWVQYVGRISYGLYVYHLLLFIPVFDFGRSIGIGWQTGDYLHGAASVIVTLVVASISWHLLERPINALKDSVATPLPQAEALALKPLRAEGREWWTGPRTRSRRPLNGAPWSPV